MDPISKSHLEGARAKGTDITKHGPVAVAARYRAGMILVELSSGVEIRFPVRLAQGLEDGNPKDLSEIKIEARGLGLHWPRLDVDLYVPSLLQGVLGTRKWMAAIGKMGGSVTSAAKAKASVENGKLGGRPKKVNAEV
jgi:Protein of unknown function (DUF2442)